MVIDRMAVQLEEMVASLQEGNEQNHLKGIYRIVNYLDENMVKPEGKGCTNAKKACGTNDWE